MFVSPSVQYFSIFGFNIYFYGIILALSIFIGIFLSNKIAIKYYSFNFVYEQSTLLIISGILGARLYYCLLNFSSYIANPLEIFYIREGGLSIHGVIIASILVLYYYSKKYKFSLLKLCDIYALSLPLAQSIGRWGNFFNSEAFGKPAYTFLKLYIAPKFRPSEYIDYSYFHPTFFYESVLDLALFIILFKFLFKKAYKTSGVITGAYCIGYGLIRLAIEPLRIDCTSFVFNIPVPIVASAIMILVGSCLILKSHSSK